MPVFPLIERTAVIPGSVALNLQNIGAVKKRNLYIHMQMDSLFWRNYKLKAYLLRTHS